ncbi:hypothetical protein [Streptomyces sp. NPDC014746]|uniref:hypothetical protein n=1 Tax=Streptomyces sp. NPDC014746 TaxID=3364904 RepID=UPI0036FE3A18
MKLNKFLAVILSTAAAVAVLVAGGNDALPAEGNTVAAPAGFGWDVAPQNAPIATLL